MDKLECHLLSIAFVVLCSCSDGPEPTQSYPVLVIDRAHSGLEQKENAEPVEYIVPPTTGLLLDCRHYEIKVSPKFAVDSPNMIHVVLGDDRMYRTSWQGIEEIHILDASTLIPQPGSKEFTGFRRGDRMIIAIGFDHTGITAGKDGVLSTMWIGIGGVE